MASLLAFLLAAGWGDLIGSALPFVVAALYIAFRWFVGAENKPPGRLPRGPAAGGRPAANPLAEIEEFLRRAAQMQAEKGRPPGPQGQPPAAPGRAAAQPPPLPARVAARDKPAPLPAAQRSKKGPAKLRQQRTLKQPAKPEVVEAEVAEGPRPDRLRPGRQLAEQVAGQGDSGRFRQRAAQLTQLDQVDEQMEEHLASVFQHQVGQLATQANTAPPPSGAQQPAAAGQLARLLRDPAGMRTAIILQEVLRRPEW